MAALRTSPLSSEAKWENFTGVPLFRELVFLEEDEGEVGGTVEEETEGGRGSTEQKPSDGNCRRSTRA